MFRKLHREETNRFRVLSLSFLALGLLIIGRLFMLQIIQHNYYALFAMNSHEIYKQIHPQRGEIFFKDKNDKEYPAAVNKEYYLVYAVPKEIKDSDVASTTNKLAEALKMDEWQKRSLLEKLSQRNSSYRAVSKKTPEELKEKIESYKIPGIYFTPEEYRFYPEDNLASTVLGFTSFDDNGNLKGKYGVEGYNDKKLAGRGGFMMGEKSALGSWITLASRTDVKAENGPDILLTIDRALEHEACGRLQEGLKEYEAKSASLVIMEPSTGAVLAMCSLPDFDPNNYSKVEDLAAFNNTTIFTPYEPGSVFKTITMAAGLDLGLVNPNTTFTDPCELTINGHKIRNAEKKCYGLQTMTQVLENSVNTGVVWVEEKVGTERFYKYVKKFGYGTKTGIALNTESAGDISSLEKKGDIFGANGSFGQGLTATPLQVAASYAAIANGGKLMKPYIIEEARYENGHREKTQSQTVEQVISTRAAKLLSGMLVSVVENHYKTGRIPNYYVAGKTGTAQIPEKGGYSADRTNHTFAGFAPAENPKFVIVVKYEEPNRKWAEQTALPVFKDVMKFALDYYAVPGDKK